jgi:hypothetical protein
MPTALFPAMRRILVRNHGFFMLRRRRYLQPDFRLARKPSSWIAGEYRGGTRGLDYLLVWRRMSF